MHVSRRGLLGAGIGALAVAGSAARADAVPAAPHDRIGYRLSAMTLEEKVGQLFVQQVFGTDASVDDPRNTSLYGTAKAVDVIAQFRPGGVIYFPSTDSFANGPSGVARLSNQLQAAVHTGSATRVGVPLFIATDQEQGVVGGLGAPITSLPSAMSLGATHSADDARTAAVITASEMRAMGVNTCLGPVCDVEGTPLDPSIGIRSFSSSPELAAEMAVAQVRGYQEGGDVVACGKHFPGYGNVDLGGREDLPVVTQAEAQWRERDLPPFRAAVEAGVDMLMTTHLVAPALDASGLPASLSPDVVTGLLREELGFDGVVITDSLDLPALRERFSDEEIALRALEAGADMLLMSPAPLAARDAIVAAVGSGRLTERMVDDRVRRILRLKEQRGLLSRSEVDAEAVDRTVNSPGHRSTAAAITDRSITVVRNNGLLPVAVESKSVLVTGVGDQMTQQVTDAFAAAGSAASRIVTGSAPAEQEIESVVMAARQVDLVVVLTRSLTPGSAQQRLVDRLQAGGTKVIAVAVRNPRGVVAHSAMVALCTYSDAPVVAPSLVRIITGRAKPRGTLPVELRSGDPQRSYPLGHGLSW